MAKILFFNVPGHGHVNPTLPVTAELRRRGHEIIYYNDEEFRPQIERTGATFRPYPGTPPTSADIIAAVNGSLIDVTLLVLDSAARLLPGLITEIQREQPDLVIYDSLALGAALAAHRLGVPTIASISTFVLKGARGMITLRDMLRIMGQFVPRIPRFSRARRALVKAYGQPLPDSLVPVVGDFNLVFTARELQPETDFVDARFAFVGPSIDPNSRANTDFPFEQLTRKPLIYISLGTIHTADRDFYQQCFEAFSASPGQVIVSAGSTDLGMLGQIPDHFIVRPSVPQLEILRRADLFITHGGMNSVQESLYFGVPMVVLPQQTEQLFNGRIVARAGAGLLLEAGGRVRADHLRAAADRLLGDSAYRETAQRLGDALRAAGGYTRAADLIEAFVHRLSIHPSAA
ncbi:MAG: glycosyl transferase [Anaerolineae bacterium]|nr:glycosyl transferase [Anaerolineae bacterium]